jgi:hypothetical protein
MSPEYMTAVFATQNLMSQLLHESKLPGPYLNYMADILLDPVHSRLLPLPEKDFFVGELGSKEYKQTLIDAAVPQWVPTGFMYYLLLKAGYKILLRFDFVSLYSANSSLPSVPNLMGDYLLRSGYLAVSKVLADVDSQCILVRAGGDEYIIMVPEREKWSRIEMQSLKDRILQKLSLVKAAYLEPGKENNPEVVLRPVRVHFLESKLYLEHRKFLKYQTKDLVRSLCRTHPEVTDTVNSVRSDPELVLTVKMACEDELLQSANKKSLPFSLTRSMPDFSAHIVSECASGALGGV